MDLSQLMMIRSLSPVSHCRFLLPNQNTTRTASYTITQSDLTQGLVINHASAQGFYQGHAACS